MLRFTALNVSRQVLSSFNAATAAPLLGGIGRFPRLTKTTGSVITALSLLSGCATFDQSADQVMIRDPKIGQYSEAVSAQATASLFWEFAVMSLNAYNETLAAIKAKQIVVERDQVPSESLSKEMFDAACATEKEPLPLKGWRLWPDFPSVELRKKIFEQGLYVEVMERTESPHTLAVVFEGTEFTEMPDWFANLRWFVRFIPGFEDQYTLTSNKVAAEFFNEISKTSSAYRIQNDGRLLNASNGEPVRIVSAGHSLGGGLAQNFAYGFKQASTKNAGPKVSEVYTFDPSPVTGWFSADDPPRTYNAEGLMINRVFEHGEVLAYLRLLTSRFVAKSENPAIWEYRFNFNETWNPIENHAMRKLACGLVNAAKPWEK